MVLVEVPRGQTLSNHDHVDSTRSVMPQPSQFHRQYNMLQVWKRLFRSVWICLGLFRHLVHFFIPHDPALSTVPVHPVRCLPNEKASLPAGTAQNMHVRSCRSIIMYSVFI